MPHLKQPSGIAIHLKPNRTGIRHPAHSIRRGRFTIQAHLHSCNFPPFGPLFGHICNIGKAVHLKPNRTGIRHPAHSIRRGRLTIQAHLHSCNFPPFGPLFGSNLAFSGASEGSVGQPPPHQKVYWTDFKIFFNNLLVNGAQPCMHLGNPTSHRFI